jgi:HEAT repeat protein
VGKGSKSRVVFFVILSAIAVGAIVLHDREPRYKGKTLSKWLHLSKEKPELLVVPGEAQEALLQIGTNAIPTALRWISYERPAWTMYAPSTLPGTARAVYNRIKETLVSNATTLANNRADSAVNIFLVLGSNAASAAPRLQELAVSSSDEQRARRCLLAISYMGHQAIPALLTIVTNSEASTARLFAIQLLPRFQTNALPAVPTLSSCLKDTNTEVATAAAQALGKIAPWAPADGALRMSASRPYTDTLAR